MIATERVQRLLEPGYLTGLDTRSLPELRSMHEECAQAELALSYFRRLAQARMEILEAEVARRERGGSLDDLVADLPRILSAESGRSTITTTRGAPAADPPTIELHWPDGREQLVVDTTLAKLPALGSTSSTRRWDRCGASNASSPTSGRSCTASSTPSIV